jgi:hypothetical protein
MILKRLTLISALVSALCIWGCCSTCEVVPITHSRALWVYSYKNCDGGTGQGSQWHKGSSNVVVNNCSGML